MTTTSAMRLKATGQFQFFDVSDRVKIKEYCSILLAEQMFIPGWGFERWFTHNPDGIDTLVICMDNGRIVGAGVIINFWFWGLNSGTLVREEYRRKGIGTELMRRMSLRTKIIAGNGKPGSYDFFKHCQNIGIQINTNR